MLEQLLLHIQRHQLCKTTDKILLAVSGGVDSMVMLKLFAEAGFAIGVAHCNFQLRGTDSEADEALVRDACDQHKIPFHHQRSNTRAFAKDSGLSIQLAARKLRYDFFEQVRVEHGYDSIATAHHLNDSLETVLLNFTRGTGLKGLSGIPVKNNFVIRPLLFASRDSLVAYANANRIAWREDSSNSHDDYQRNFLRHQVIPRLKEINPNLEQTFAITQERISGAVEMTEQFLNEFKSTSCRERDGSIFINRNDITQYSRPQVILWELLKSKGFNYEQCEDVFRATQSGKQFYSSTHGLTVDRESLIITQRKHSGIRDTLIEEGVYNVINGFQQMRLEKRRSQIEIDKHPFVANLDAAKVTFPLCWRRWKPGDSFQPLGMSTHKKISDLLIDLKIPAPEKETITVVESGGEIIWVVGQRISDAFKITPATTHLLSLKVTKLEGEKIS